MGLRGCTAVGCRAGPGALAEPVASALACQVFLLPGGIAEMMLTDETSTVTKLVMKERKVPSFQLCRHSAVASCVEHHGLEHLMQREVL